MAVHVTVHGVPEWVDAHRLLGEGDWQPTADGWGATLERRIAADLSARLRGVVLGGQPVRVDVRPPLKRSLVRAARTDDARRRRHTTPGFTRPGVRLDPQTRTFVTPEALALALARPYAGRSVVDATCGAGGNAIAFARAGCRVTAIDRDRDRVEQARHNATLYGVADRITFRVGRAETLDLAGDVLFIDPPWQSTTKVTPSPAEGPTRTTLDDLPVLAALLPLGERFQTVLAKVPPSFDPSTTPGAVPEAWFGEAPGDYRRVKLVLLRWT